MLAAVHGALHILKDVRVIFLFHESSGLLAVFGLRKVRILGCGLGCEIECASLAIVVSGGVHGVPNAPVFGKKVQECAVCYHYNLG